MKQLFCAFAVIFTLLTGLTPVEAANLIRVYVPYGQGGWVISYGMILLANKIAAIDRRRIKVTTHSFAMGGVAQTLYDDMIRQPPGTTIVVLSFSLGVGGGLEAVKAYKRPVALFVAYDPSRWQTIPPVPANIARVRQYTNQCAAVWGGAKLSGPQVSTLSRCNAHLAMDFDPQLHSDTLGLVKGLLK